MGNGPDFLQLALRARHIATMEADQRISNCWLSIAECYRTLARLAPLEQPAGLEPPEDWDAALGVQALASI